jgi:predicted nuclease with TOPRIM domain
MTQNARTCGKNSGMSNSDDTTQPIGTADYADPARTRTDLRALMIDAVREVVTADILPRLTALEARIDRIEQRMERLEARMATLETTFRHHQRDVFNRITDLEDAVGNTPTKPAA